MQIPPLSPQKYKKEQTPKAAWFAIETCGHTLMPFCPTDPLRPLKKGEKHIETITPETLRKLAESFDPAENGGRGLFINDSHLYLKTAANTRAKGWLRAVQVHGNELWGFVEWTDEGHDDLRKGYYWATSSEYRGDNFILNKKNKLASYWEPQKLAGLALTNNPGHKSQSGIVCHTANNNIIMPDDNITDEELEALTAQQDATPAPSNPPATEADTPIIPQEGEGTTLIEDEEEPTQANEEAGDTLPALVAFVEEVASILGADANEAPESIIQRLKSLKSDYAALSASSNTATQTNTRMQWRQAAKAHQRISTPATPTMDSMVTMQLNTGDTVRVNRKEWQQSQTRRRHVEEAQMRLGRQLTQGELNRIWNT